MFALIMALKENSNCINCVPEERKKEYIFLCGGKNGHPMNIAMHLKTARFENVKRSLKRILL